MINSLYQNTKDSPLTDKLDLRTELTVIKKQMMPVVVNEVMVRSLYFIRHMISQGDGVKESFNRIRKLQGGVPL